MNEKTNTPEPLAAILAEMRDFAKPRRVGGDLCSNIACPATISIWADRVEAAAARERENTIYAGRDGEMTLDECIIRCDNNSGDDPRGRDIAQIGSWLRELRALRTAPGNAAAIREALEQVKRDNLFGLSLDSRNKIFAALAAPARNADRFATAKEALDAFIREKEITSSDVDSMNLRDFFDWLFAPAEGGAE